MGSDNHIGQPAKFNSQEYLIDIKLINHSTIFTIPLGIVREIHIIDDLYSVFTEARLSINNTGNVLDEFVTDPELKKIIIGENYQFNSDGNDFIHIKIVPTDGGNNDSYSHENFLYDNIYTIYDEDEIVTRGDSAVKTKMFKLRDVRETALENTHVSWSTADVVRSEGLNQINISKLGNSEREVKTGVAIKHLLKSTLPEHSYTFGLWEDGLTKTFHTSSPDHNAFDDLETLLDKHLSENGDNCVLKATNFELELIAISDLMKRDEKRISEIMSFPTVSPQFEDIDQVISIIPGYNITREDLDGTPTSNNFSLLNISNIDSDKELITPIVHSYSAQDKQFTIDGEFNNIVKIKDRMQNLYADIFPLINGSTQKAILPINSNKVSNKLANHVFSSGNTQIERLKCGINKVLNKALALSPAMHIATEGYTPRKPGRSVVVGIADIDQRSPLAKLLLGEWMMTKVSHLFVIDNQQYVNDIVMNKTHSSEELLPQDHIDSLKEYYEEIKG